MRSKPHLQLGEVILQDCGGHRQTSRSVSWNSTGSWLASASSDRLAKIWSVEGGSGPGREVTALTGHNAPLERVRFHPIDSTLLCTAAQDRTIRFWDVRASNARNIAKMDLLSSSRYGNCPASIEWHPGRSSSGGGSSSSGSSNRYLAVAEKDNTVHVYDVRKLYGSSGSSSTKSRSSPGQTNPLPTPIQSFKLHPHVLQECHFSPSGTHLVAATRAGSDGMGEIRIWPWEKRQQHQGGEEKEEEEKIDEPAIFEGHTGAIYTHRFSPDGKRLATGGNDAIVGLWDVSTMVCTHTIIRRTKFIRCVSFSHDSKLLAISSEEDGIDVAEAETGDCVGIVSITSSSNQRQLGGSKLGGGGGADEVAFHPKAYVLACARGEPVGVSGTSMSSTSPLAQVTVARLSIS